MPTIEDLFHVHRARSGLFSEYEPGNVSYVGNTSADNGTVGFVTPLPNDRIFRARAIVVSAFCDATIHIPPFVACGRAGNGLLVLEPRKLMPPGELAYHAAFINSAVKWRFNWYRQVTADRLRSLNVPANQPRSCGFPVTRYLPLASKRKRVKWEPNLRPFALDSLFELIPGTYHSLGDLEPGEVPVVSCGNEDNGVAGYYHITEHLHRNRLTIALNGSPLATKYHPYTFAAKDDVAICLPRQPMGLASLLFIQSALETQRWRYSYYRKCYMSKLRRFTVHLPATDDVLDQETMRHVVEGAPYWEYLSGAVTQE